MPQKIINTDANAKKLSPPDTAQCIVIGRFAAPFGVRGWLHIIAFGARDDSFIQNRAWWCAPDSEDLSAGNWQWIVPEDIRHGGSDGRGLAVKFPNVETREQAAAWRGGGIALPRHCLPSPPPQEYYWCDLIGLLAINEEGVQLGRISDLMRTGAHDVLRIVPSVATNGGEMLVPFIEQYVLDVDTAGGVVRLRWQPDWL